MLPYMQEMLATLHHQEALHALLAEKRASASRQHIRVTTPQRATWGRTVGTWRLRLRARHARLRKRSYTTPWLEDLHRIVEAQRHHPR
ncbi:MAG: hypothetical protein H0X24_08780 [Ktedonobacterales bacterium]|nr:hypothetical protein [Ktedonobacterales bacterium]